MSGIALVFALASLGLPGFGNFIAEFLVLAGAYPVDSTITAFAAAGLVLAAVYSLWMVQRVFQGEPRDARALTDLSLRETAVLASMIAAIVWLGLFPGPVLEATKPALNGLQYIEPSSDRIEAAGAGAPGAAAGRGPAGRSPRQP
jgi:NADH-quinone oxidoreductase subunit M